MEADGNQIFALEAIRPSETSVDFQRNTRRSIPEDRTPHKIYVSRISSK
jgi:hypothetical protein